LISATCGGFAPTPLVLITSKTGWAKLPRS